MSGQRKGSLTLPGSTTPTTIEWTGIELRRLPDVLKGGWSGIKLDGDAGMLHIESGRVTIAAADKVYPGLYDGTLMDTRSGFLVHFRGMDMPAGVYGNTVAVGVPFPGNVEFTFEKWGVSTDASLAVGQFQVDCRPPKNLRRRIRRAMALGARPFGPSPLLLRREPALGVWPPVIPERYRPEPTPPLAWNEPGHARAAEGRRGSDSQARQWLHGYR